MKASELVQKMVADFERKSGKPATEIALAPELYESLRRELAQKVPAGMVVDTIRLHGVLIQKKGRSP